MPTTSTSIDALQSVYDRIKRLILSGTFAMGQRVTELDLATRLGLSRTPIREALRRLHAEGLIDFRPHCGYRVVAYSVDDLEQISACRLVLEAEAIRLVAQRGIPQPMRRRMGQLLAEGDQILQAASLNDLQRHRLLDINNEFHRLLYLNCGNAPMLDMIRRLTEVPVCIRNYAQFSDAEIQQSQQDHYRIFKAVLQGQPDHAARLLRDHISSAKDKMSASLASSPPRLAAA